MARRTGRRGEAASQARHATRDASGNRQRAGVEAAPVDTSEEDAAQRIEYHDSRMMHPSPGHKHAMSGVSAADSSDDEESV